MIAQLPMNKERPIEIYEAVLSGDPLPTAVEIMTRTGLGLNRYRHYDFLLEEDQYLQRGPFRERFGFSLPCAEVVARLKELSPLISVGAGMGFMELLLARAGADIVASDIKGKHRQGYRLYHEYFPVERRTAVSAIKAYPERTVLSIWPSYAQRWTTLMVKAIAEPGRHFAMIGETHSGCCGTDGMFRELDTKFEEIDVISVPQWSGLYDCCTIYRRK